MVTVTLESGIWDWVCTYETATLISVRAYYSVMLHHVIFTTSFCTLDQVLQSNLRPPNTE